MNYRKANNLLGWITATIAYSVYLLTMERTASFWDCGEFLACGAKVEVGHSPGAPFFMLLQRLFAMCSPAPDKTAIFVNSLSALTSALTILFLFWTITHFAKKILAGKQVPDVNQTLLILGAGLVGALAYTFSDTFWFSAVEAEVYGTSSFFTAITVWAILKWEDVADNKYADRWLLLIAYLIGLSVSVHLLNLLTIPVVTMVYYFRRYNYTRMGVVAAFFIGCAFLAFVQFGVIQYVPIFASKFDIFFTNSLGLPFDTGSLTFLLLFLALLIGLLVYAKRKNKYLLHTGILCTMFILMGYSAYIVALIRSRADVPIDMTNPDNALSLQAYVSREQFGEQPLLFGPDFTSPVTDVKSKGIIYSSVKENGKDHYEETGKKLEPVYDPSTIRFFPRIYEVNEGHPQFYRSLLGLSEGDQPTASDNINYFINYQMNWMWWRYFMWNYAGRQNDIEGQGEAKNGNWISGIKFLDNPRVGNLDKMPIGYRDNEARNQLYFLPLILGILGMILHFKKNAKEAFVVLLLFFFTGAAIGIYLNMPPGQPRERDYAFAGCTYAFAIWIGLGVLMVAAWLQRMAKQRIAIAGATVICLLAVPVLMAKEEWDDHDRSGKTLARSTAYNVLTSCAPNAILITFADNDTYPLWYLQEVEGVRKDVRIVINTLMGTSWFIDQLNYKINEADAAPMAWQPADYAGSRRDYVRFYNDQKVPQDKFISLYDVCKFMVSDDPNNKLQNNNGETENYFPTQHFYVPTISKEQLVQNGMLSQNDSSNIINEMKFTVSKNTLYKNDITMLNIIAETAKEGWKRPIYFSGAYPGNDGYLGLGNYLRQEGMVYRLVPYSMANAAKADGRNSTNIDADKSYSLFMNKYLWGGGNTNTVYFDDKNRNMMMAYRLNASHIADELSAKGRNAEAVRLLDKVMAGITEHAYYYDAGGFYLALSYYRAGAKDKGKALSLKIAKNSEDDIAWLNTLDDDKKEGETRDVQNDLAFVNTLASAAHTAGDEITAQLLTQKFEALYKRAGSMLKLPGR